MKTKINWDTLMPLIGLFTVIFAMIFLLVKYILWIR